MADKETRRRLIYALGLFLVLLSLAKVGGIATSDHGGGWRVVVVLGLLGTFCVGWANRGR